MVGILIAFSAVWTPAHTSDPKISLRRATSDSLLIDVDYHLSNVSLKWEYKRINFYEKWEEVEEIRRISLDNKVAYYLRNLNKTTTYRIRLKVEPGGLISKELEAKTCSDFPPAVEDLRVKDAGPGWIDVRWKPPRDDCPSQLEYLVEYKADSRTFPEEMSFGHIEKANPFADPRPHHPCPHYPSEFCVLLTDHVVAGKNHTIQVAVHRIDTSYSSHSTLELTTILVDPKNYGRNDPQPCEPIYYQQEDTDIDKTRQIVLPVWCAVTLGVGYTAALGGILAWYLISKRKHGEESRLDQSLCVEEYELYEEMH